MNDFEKGCEEVVCERCARKDLDNVEPLKFQYFRGEFLCEECLAEEESCGCSDPAD